MLNKFLINPLRQRFVTLWISQKQVQEWASQWKFFFVLGFGRSGTAFLANLLGQSPDACVFHEPVLEDYNAFVEAFYSLPGAQRYFRGFRMKEIYSRMRHNAPAVYGEVNGTLRRHAAAIQRELPDAAVIHLVRDGRDVLRSNVTRLTMTTWNPITSRIHPPKGDPYAQRWGKMDRFARLCWFWQDDNAYLRRTTGRTVQFEKVLSSYEYFDSEILQPCRIRLDKEIWQAAIGSPLNVTVQHQMPKWEGWTAEQQNTFREICAEEMANCGYTI